MQDGSTGDPPEGEPLPERRATARAGGQAVVNKSGRLDETELIEMRENVVQILEDGGADRVGSVLGTWLGIGLGTGLGTGPGIGRGAGHGTGSSAPTEVSCGGARCKRFGPKHLNLWEEWLGLGASADDGDPFWRYPI